MFSVSAISRNMRGLDRAVNELSDDLLVLGLPDSINAWMVCRLPWMTVSRVRSSWATWPVNSSAAVLNGFWVKARMTWPS